MASVASVAASVPAVTRTASTAACGRTGPHAYCEHGASRYGYYASVAAMAAVASLTVVSGILTVIGLATVASRSAAYACAVPSG